VILLHSRDGNQLVWKNGLAERLQREGYAVLAVDLRKHGESKKAGGVAVEIGQGTKTKTKGPKKVAEAAAADLKKDDYEKMVSEDLAAVKRFLYDEHQAQRLNMRKTAIVAADMTCPLAGDFAWKDWIKTPHNDAPTLEASTPRGQDVRALVLLSPDVSAANLRTGASMLQLRNPVWQVAFLVCNGSKDALDKGTAEDVYKQVSGIAQNESRTYHKTYDTKFRGTDLLGKKLQVEEHILAFLEKHLKQLPDTWQNRKSRL
jgi:pimeloyl-ACP methyl ester carboxylesterase